ncbi:hypothetical protein Pen02_82820 [Plantactinospora endophytica]|uniref:Uncharacterized protein n=1 Tax=Plantactinospora endophytica TaxID=673535 RepID=A0ABQ4EGH6_9ACTN|nr:hypothetical protein Pen02_82820 [Plantactinospora endophytica]
MNLDRVAKFAAIANAFAQTALAVHGQLEMQIETDRTLSRQAGYRQI